MTRAVTHHPEHETSPWPLLTGMGVLLSALSLLAYFPWHMPLLGVVLGGMVLALLAVGISGWVREFFTSGAEAGLGPVALAFAAAPAAAHSNRPALQDGFDPGSPRCCSSPLPDSWVWWSDSSSRSPACSTSRPISTIIFLPATGQ